MSTNKLIRLSGIAAMLCGLATAVFWFVHPSAADPRAVHDAAFFAAVQSPAFVSVFLLFVALILASLLALIGYYVRLFATSGIAGLISFLVAFVGTAMFLASGVFQCGVAPVLARSPATRLLLEPAGPLLGGILGLLFAGTGCTFALGYLLLGITMLRTGVFPGWAAVLLMLGAPVLGLSPLMPLWARVLGCLCWGAGNLWLGYVQLAAGGDLAVAALDRSASRGLQQAA